jgi:MFS family permease
MLPLTVGFLVAGPASGWLSDRFGARPFATGGMVAAATCTTSKRLSPRKSAELRWSQATIWKVSRLESAA